MAVQFSGRKIYSLNIAYKLKIMKSKALILLVSLVISLNFFVVVDAVNATVVLQDPLGVTNTINPIPELINRLIQTALGFSGVLALLAFIYGGILYLTAGIDSNNIKKAKEVMKYAVMGLMIIFLSSPIVIFILETVLKVKR